MPTIFHILDAISRDQITTITRETEEEQEVEVEFEEDGRIYKAKDAGGQKQTRGLVIHLFGMTAEGEPIRCDVEGFEPYLYLKVPPKTDPAFLKDLLKANGHLPASLSLQLVKRKELFGFTADEDFTFMKLSVDSLKDFRDLKKLVLNDYQEPIFSTSKSSPPLPVYESGLDPLLRFFHLRDLAPCGWASAEGDSTEDEESGIRVVTCRWTDVTKTVAPKPTAPFKTLFWDIECYSQSGDFPVAKPKSKKDLGDPIIQIGCVLTGSDGTLSRIIFVLDSEYCLS